MRRTLFSLLIIILIVFGVVLYAQTNTGQDQIAFARLTLDYPTYFTPSDLIPSAQCKLELPESPLTYLERRDENTCIIKIGIVNPFSRNDACFDGGTELKQGYEIAIKEISEQNGLHVNGCHIELVQVDDLNNASNAAEAVSNLADRDASVILGAYSSSATLAAAKEADRQSIPLIVPSASSDLITKLGYDWVFRINATSSDYVELAMDLIETIPITTTSPITPTQIITSSPSIAVIYINRPFGESAAVAVTTQAESRGMSVVAYESFASSDDLVTSLTTIQQADPDIVYIAANNITDAINLFEISNTIELKPKLFIANAGAFINPKFLEAIRDQAVTEASYVVVTGQWAADLEWGDNNNQKWPDAQSFINTFQELRQAESAATSTVDAITSTDTTDAPAPILGMRTVQAYTVFRLAYDAVYACAEEGKTSALDQRTCVNNKLHSLDAEPTIFGPITFNTAGQNDHEAILVQIIPTDDGSYEFATVFPENRKKQDVYYPNHGSENE